MACALFGAGLAYHRNGIARTAREEKRMRRGLFVAATALVVGAAVSSPVVCAQPIEHGRGVIVSIDANRGTMELKDPQGRTGTWKFDRSATVKFTDGAGFFPNPSTADLRPPMYVHFTFSNEVIQTFDVVELGFQPGSDESASGRKQPGSPRSVTGSVVSYDANVRQLALDTNGRRETFQLTARSDRQLNPGERVQLNTEWVGSQELVSSLRVLGSSGNQAAAGGDSQSAEGRVVRISARGVVMQVAGAEQTYAVDNSRLLQRLRVGTTVQFSWQDRGGRLYITDVR
jgi:hypothetical protein